MELVWELPAAAMVRAAQAEPGDPEGDPFCSFWTGDDPRVHAELCELLDKEKIPHKTVRREDHLFSFSSFPTFQMGIPFSMFERAEAVVQEAYGSEEAIQPAARLLPVDSDHIPGTRFDADAFEGGRRAGLGFSRGAAKTSFDADREDSTASGNSGARYGERESEDEDAWDARTEVWSGDEPELAEFIGASLQMNEIPFRREARAGKQIVCVSREDEARARQIVREVVEGAPPE
ncbi:MAG: hypothetical protein WBW58_13575 [Candidatus Acidiferrum sp.]